ncbi:MAG: hypothetical protein SF052_00520 [Bacteroidia bacterium]|nr:hypothetical protein [Bacteroidia bacterium]
MNLIVRFFSIFLLATFLLISENIFAQDQIFIRRNYQPGHTDREQMVAQYYPFNSTLLDLRDFRERYPEYKNVIPEEVTVRPPDLTGMKDVVYSVSYLEVPGELEGILLITLIGNYFNQEAIHFFDFNLDRNFTNDPNGRFIFPKETEVQSFTFTKTGQSFKRYTLEILNPEFQVSTNPDFEMQQLSQQGQMALPEVDYQNLDKPVKGIPRKKQLLSLKLDGLIGFGGIKYSYIIPATQYPSNYNMEFNTKGLGAEVSIKVKQIRIGVNARIENLFYWSSERYTQIQEPYTSCETDWRGRQICTYYDGIMQEINRDLKPKNRYSFNLTGEYVFPVTRKTNLTPYLEAGFMHYINDHFIPERFYTDINYPFGWFQVYGGGLRLEHEVSNNGEIVVSGGVQNMQFNPRGYFDGVENLRRRHVQGFVSMGYRFAVL